MNTAVAEKTAKESIVAILPVMHDKEIALSKSVMAMGLEAESVIIECDDEYKAAAEFGRRIKQAAENVKQFFKPMKDDAYRAHKTICEREKTMLAPLAHAEKALKNAMEAYSLRKEQERKAAEEAARRLVREEAERKLAFAAEQEKAGDAKKAESALLDAQIADSMSRTMQVFVPVPKADGVSTSKDWEITSVDLALVPAEISGILIRPVDTAAVMRLIRSSKGTVQIPGIAYKETAKMSIRR